MELVITIELLACLLLIGGGIVGLVRARSTTETERPAPIKAAEAGVITGAVLIAGVLFLSALQLAIAAQAARRDGGPPVMPAVALADVLGLTIFMCAGFTIIGWARAVRHGRLPDIIVLLSLCSIALLMFGASVILELERVFSSDAQTSSIAPRIIHIFMNGLIFGCSVRTIICLIRAMRTTQPPPGFPV